MIRLLPPIVAAIGIAVLVLGYGLGYAPITTLIPGANSMKPITAAMFAVSGLILPMTYRKHGFLSGPVLTWLVIYMVVLMTAAWSGIAHVLGLVDWLPGLNEGPPSIGTMLAFGVVLVIGGRALAGMAHEPRLGWVMLAFGASSTLGYLLNLPWLYFEFGTYGAMAVHTGACFAALGYGHLRARVTA